MDFATASASEWLLSDGLGGYAAGTRSGAPTRRSHVLLAAALPHGDRLALVQRLEEKLLLDGTQHELSAAYAPGRAPREGAWAQLEQFRAEPWPRWRWRFDDVVIEKSVRLVDGHNGVAISYRLVAGRDARLAVAPLLTARSPLGLMAQTPEFKGTAQGIPGRVRFETLPGMPGVTLWHNGAFLPARNWTHGVEFPLDDAAEWGDARALDAPLDESFLPGWVQFHLAQPGASAHLVLSSEEALFRSLAAEQRLGTPPAQSIADCLAALERGALERRAAWKRRTTTGADLTARQAAMAHGGDGERLARRSEPLVDEHDALTPLLAQHLLDALVRRQGRTTLVCGWPDPVERGTEVLRAATALVAVRAFEPAREIARGYLEYLDEGLAPEWFDPTDGTPRYGDPEPSLWLVHLVDLLVRRSTSAPAQDEFVRDVAWPALEGVLQHLRMGSRHGVRCDREGLLWSGEADAARARAGTNALWYHALVAMAQLGKLLGRRENAAFYLAWAHDLQRRYCDTFWDDDAGCLFDAISAAGPVRGVAPDQLWAIALPPALLPAPLAGKLLVTLEREPGPGRAFRVPGRKPAAPRVVGSLGRGAAARARARRTLAPPRRRGVRTARVRRPLGLAARARRRARDPLDARLGRGAACVARGSRSRRSHAERRARLSPPGRRDRSNSCRRVTGCYPRGDRVSRSPYGDTKRVRVTRMSSPRLRAAWPLRATTRNRRRARHAHCSTYPVDAQPHAWA
ncbi:MAG: glycogen debranching enzyme N-terminal domain-containing protein [Candidatus Eisenbacteria bacterium]